MCYTNIKKSNILWIDYAKFFGISLVIFGHVLQVLNLTENSDNFNFLWKFIYLFHMPLFFIISGYLYNQQKTEENLKKIVNGLLIPYFIFQVIFFPFIFFNKILLHNESFFQAFTKCICGILLGDFYETSSSYPVCGPCWFIISIIQLRLLFLKIKLNIYNILLFLITSILMLKILFYIGFDCVFCVDNTLMAIPYFLLGYLAKQSNFIYIIGEKIKKYKIKIINLGILICIFILNYLLIHFGCVQMNLKISDTLVPFKISLLATYIAGFIGSLMIFLISLLFKQDFKFIQKISKNTLFIIFFHFLLCFLMRWSKIYKITELIQNDVLTMLLVISLTAFILVINYFAIILIEKHFPIVLGKYKILKKEKICL